MKMLLERNVSDLVGYSLQKPRLTGSADALADGFEGGHSSIDIATAQILDLRLNLRRIGAANDREVRRFALSATRLLEARNGEEIDSSECIDLT